MAVSVGSEAAKLPPQNQEAETSVLGAIMLSEQALDALLIDVKLTPEHFYRERHRLIFRAMIALKGKTDSAPVDVVTVCDELERAGELEEAGGRAYVYSLPNLVPSAANIRQYAKHVRVIVNHQNRFAPHSQASVRAGLPRTHLSGVG